MVLAALTLAAVQRRAIRMRRGANVGAPPHMAATWFAGLLRDGFALTAVDASESFSLIAAEALRVSLDPRSLNRETEQAAQRALRAAVSSPIWTAMRPRMRPLTW